MLFEIRAFRISVRALTLVVVVCRYCLFVCLFVVVCRCCLLLLLLFHLLLFLFIFIFFTSIPTFSPSLLLLFFIYPCVNYVTRILTKHINRNTSPSEVFPHKPLPASVWTLTPHFCTVDLAVTKC